MCGRHRSGDSDPPGGRPGPPSDSDSSPAAGRELLEGVFLYTRAVWVYCCSRAVLGTEDPGAASPSVAGRGRSGPCPRDPRSSPSPTRPAREERHTGRPLSLTWGARLTTGPMKVVIRTWRQSSPLPRPSSDRGCARAPSAFARAAGIRTRGVRTGRPPRADLPPALDGNVWPPLIGS